MDNRPNITKHNAKYICALGWPHYYASKIKCAISKRKLKFLNRKTYNCIQFVRLLEDGAVQYINSNSKL